MLLGVGKESAKCLHSPHAPFPILLVSPDRILRFHTWALPNSHFPFQNSEFRIPNSHFPIRNSEFRLPNSGSLPRPIAIAIIGQNPIDTIAIGRIEFAVIFDPHRTDLRESVIELLGGLGNQTGFDTIHLS